MEGADEAIRIAQQEIEIINDELLAQEEKLTAIQAKLEKQKGQLYYNDSVLMKLRNSLKIGHFIALILMIALIFSALLLLILGKHKPIDFISKNIGYNKRKIQKDLH